MNLSDSRGAFFRQSGWMAVATLVGGVFNIASNLIAQRMPPGQFNIFDTALSALAIFGIPAVGMQAAFAAQAAGADGDQQRSNLSATMRWALRLLSIVWLAMAVWWLLRREQIMAAYNLSHPVMLVLLGLLCLVTLLTPVPNGVLQGRQDFLWFGWATLLNGVGRFVVLGIVVLGLKLGAIGGLTGVFAGSLLVLAIVSARTWNLFRAPPGEFHWRDWLRRLLPTTFGLGVLIFMMQADALVVRDKLQPVLTSDEIDGYSAVRKIGQGLLFVVVALVNVMFPKVARSFHRSEKTDAFKLTLWLTSSIAVAGAIVATLWPELPLLVSPPRLRESKILVPGYCWALVPLALSNVMIWSLLARECFRIVWWLPMLAVGYAGALWFYSERVTSVILVMGICNALLLAMSGVFAWIEFHRPNAAKEPATVGK